jgi:hypothetical protein
MSKMDFTPAEITATGVFPSSVKSEEMSMAASKCKVSQVVSSYL